MQVNTFRTIIQMTFTTYCCGVLLTAQCTYINPLPNIIFVVILNSCFGALPNMRGNMFLRRMGGGGQRIYLQMQNWVKCNKMHTD